jgi:glycoprotein endo-alpha-1,2-mannosidase
MGRFFLLSLFLSQLFFVDRSSKPFDIVRKNMFDWVLRESETGWWSTTCGSAYPSVCAAPVEPEYTDEGGGAENGNSNGYNWNDEADDFSPQDPETGFVITNQRYDYRRQQQDGRLSPPTPAIARRPGGGAGRNPPGGMDAAMASIIHRTCDSFDEACESLSPGSQPTQKKRSQKPQLQPLHPRKTDSILTLQSDASITVSDNSERDEADPGATDAATLRRRRRFIVWMMALILGLVALGLVIGIPLSSSSKNGSPSGRFSNADGSDSYTQVPQSNGDEDFLPSVGSPSPEGTSGRNSTGMESNSEGSGVGSQVPQANGTGTNGTEEALSFTSPPEEIPPSLSPTVSPSESTSSPAVGIDLDEPTVYDYTVNTDYLVGVYYYPWHGDDFHNREGYLRSQLTPPHQPALGEYDDSRPEVIQQHLAWSRKANIGLWVTSWWGPNDTTDTNTKDVIMQHEDVGNLKIALHYETMGRIKANDMSTTRTDMQYMCEHYFDHPNYYKIDDRPVLVIYVTRALHSDGILEEALLTMRSEVSKCGKNLYLIGDQVFASAPNPDEPFVPFWYFDAVTNYDVYGSSGQPNGFAGIDLVDNYYLEQEKWRQQALAVNCRFIPPVSPGYNDRGVRLESDHPPLSRRVTADAQEGSLFWYQLRKALPLVDPAIDNVIFVNSFNEWHEDTQIEPAIGDPASEPVLLTGGLTYVGYGNLFLDILAAATLRGADDDVFDYLLSGGS